MESWIYFFVYLHLAVFGPCMRPHEQIWWSIASVHLFNTLMDVDLAVLMSVNEVVHQLFNSPLVPAHV